MMGAKESSGTHEVEDEVMHARGVGNKEYILKVHLKNIPCT